MFMNTKFMMMVKGMATFADVTVVSCVQNVSQTFMRRRREGGN
jgi:hypothetical protein